MAAMSPTTVEDVDVGGPLRLGIDDVGHGGAAEPAEAEAEVERRAEHHDDVGPGLRAAPRVRRNASSWSAGRVPRPSPFVNTGTRRCWTAWASCSSAPAQ